MLQSELDKVPEQFREKLALFSDDWVVDETYNPNAGPVEPFEIRKRTIPGSVHVSDKTWRIEVQDGKIVGAPGELDVMIGWTGERLMQYLRGKNMTVKKLTE